MNILCNIGIHKFKKIKDTIEQDGSVEESFKCTKCGIYKSHIYKPNAHHYNNLNDNTC